VLEPLPEPSYIPVRRPVLPLERLGALVEILICSGFPTQIFLILVVRGLMGIPMLADDGTLSPPFVFTVSLLDAVAVVGLVLVFLRAHHESPRAVLFGDRRIGREALLGIAILPAVFMLVVLVLVAILRFAPYLHNVQQNPMEGMLRTRENAAIFAVVVMIAGGVREEVQRGFIAHRFGQYLGGALWGVAVYSVFFGLGHFEQGYDAMIATGVLGLVWGLLYISRRSIVAPMVSHAAFNLAQLLKYLAFAAR
jgi:membrane protease YdiL (CAAX protease family)